MPIQQRVLHMLEEMPQVFTLVVQHITLQEKQLTKHLFFLLVQETMLQIGLLGHVKVMGVITQIEEGQILQTTTFAKFKT